MSIAETIYVRTIEDVVHWSQWVREAEMRGEISHEQARFSACQGAAIFWVGYTGASGDYIRESETQLEKREENARKPV
ncbi:MAG TPA: hypothetical protein VJN92_21595 [Candidatus Acidoferrum sp.]|nr:hypothetical protein [Candidatus Acidoferrum sp.]